LLLLLPHCDSDELSSAVRFGSSFAADRGAYAPDVTGRTRVALLLFVQDERLVGSELHCRICVGAVALP